MRKASNMIIFFIFFFCLKVISGVCAASDVQDWIDQSGRVSGRGPNINYLQHLGRHFKLIRQGKVYRYWDGMCKDAAEHSVRFDEGIKELKTHFIKSWRDPYGRMPWVSNVRKDIVDFLQNLSFCEDLHCVPCIEGAMKMRMLRKEIVRDLYVYSILSYVATHVAQEDSSREFIICSSKEKFEFFCKMHGIGNALDVRAGVKSFCQSHGIEKEGSSIWLSIYNRNVSVIHKLYECDSLSFGKELSFSLHSHINIAMPEWFAALEGNKLWCSMPYLHVTDHHCNDSWRDATSWDYFTEAMFYNHYFSQFAALWHKIFWQERYPCEYLMHEMKHQMQVEKRDLTKVLQVMIAFFYTMLSVPLEGLVAKDSAELLQFFMCQKEKESGVKTYMCHLVQQVYGQPMKEGDALHLLKKWQAQYFVPGLQRIIGMYNLKFNDYSVDQNCSFTREFGLSHPSVWDILKLLEKVGEGYGCKRSLEDELQRCYSEKTQLPEQAWMQRATDRLKGTHNVRYTLWSHAAPFVEWHDAQGVVVVCLPAKKDMALHITDINNMGTPAPLCQLLLLNRILSALLKNSTRCAVFESLCTK